MSGRTPNGHVLSRTVPVQCECGRPTMLFVSEVTEDGRNKTDTLKCAAYGDCTAPPLIERYRLGAPLLAWFRGEQVDLGRMWELIR